MELVEVVLQGVKGSPPLSRWAFGARGVSIVPAGEREALVARAAYELLAGVVDGSFVQPAVLGGEAGAQARCGVVVTGRDQRRYRVLWDLQSGRRALQVQSGDKYEVVTTTQAEILQALTATVGFPQQDALREIFFCFPEDLPSKRKDGAPVDRSGKNAAAPSSSSGSSGNSGKPLPPGFGDAAPVKDTGGKPLPPGFDVDAGPRRSKWTGKSEDELRARLAEIAVASSSQTDVSGLEFELDGLQKRIFELEARTKPLQEAQRTVDGLDTQLQAFAPLDGLPDDFLEQATTMQKHTVEHGGALTRIEGERERLLESAQHLSDDVSGIRRRGGPRPLQAAMQDPLVKFGLAGGVAAILLGLVGGFAAEGLRWVALLDIPAFAVAVFGGIRLLGDLEEGASFRIKLARLDGEKKKLEERFTIDKEQIDRLLQRVRLTAEELPEVQTQWKLRAELRERRNLAMQQRDQHQQNGDIASLKAEQEAAHARIKELEEKLAHAGQSWDGGASADLAREKSEIEAALRAGNADGSADEAGGYGEEDDGGRKPTLDELMGGAPAPVTLAPPAVAAFDVGQRIIRLASDLLVASLEDACTRLGPRAGQMVQALTDRRFSEVQFGPRGEVSVVDAASSEAMPFVQLPAGDRDLIALALRFAVVEAVARANPQNRMPVVFDRVFDHLPVEKAPLLVRALQFLAQGTQVICFTGRRELAPAGPVVTAA